MPTVNCEDRKMDETIFEERKLEETILFPSPNWFQVSVLAVTRDGWLIYGGPSKSFCFLQPLNPDTKGIVCSTPRYHAHYVCRAHVERIVSVDVSPLWPEKRNILTGSSNGTVKQWNVEVDDEKFSVKSTHSHSTHFNETEEIVGVGYSSESYGITLGAFGNIIRWDLTSNVVKPFSYYLRTYKPSSLACSPHIQLNVAVGTRQGVVFVLDLNGHGKLLYKVRAQDDEIINLSWCPQYEVLVRKVLSKQKSPKTSESTPSTSGKKPNTSKKRESISDRMDKIRNLESEPEPVPEPETINKSGLEKDLPEDSFEESYVQEDDFFDRYKDHEADEFGHKKFEPVDVLVKVKEETEQDDFLSECLNLKEEILKRKNEADSQEQEQSIQSLVEALDNTHVENGKAINDDKESDKQLPLNRGGESSVHVQRHLLATIGRQGTVRIWSKTGKLISSCMVNPGHRAKKDGRMAVNLLWYKPNVLLIVDGKDQLLECDPLTLPNKNKIVWRVVHALHRRGLYGIVTNAPRVQVAGQTNESGDNWQVWTIAQDRNMICYSMEEKKVIGIYNTCGGFIYSIAACPYDAYKFGIAVGDGAVRVWESEILDDDDTRVGYGKFTASWQNVQGKVLQVAWHPTRENVLAFATGEARVGVLDTSGKCEKPARTFVPALKGAVYSLCWGAGNDLYACGGEELAVYRGNKPDAEPVIVKVEFEGSVWELSSVTWYPTMLLCGSTTGAVAVLTPDTREVITAAYFFKKMIHSMILHPKHTTFSNEVSPYKNMIAVTSQERLNKIIILEYNTEGEKPVLQVLKSLQGHTGLVLQLAWSPHRDGQLASTSQDGTVRVWDISDGSCIAIYSMHDHPISVAWSGEPARSTVLFTGGSDCCMRAWDLRRHPPHLYKEVKHEDLTRKERKKLRLKKFNEIKAEEDLDDDDDDNDDGEETKNQIATTLVKQRVPKKFLLPIINKQTAYCNIQSIRKLAQKFLVTGDEEQVKTDESEEKEIDMDYLKLFGTTNELNEILDMESNDHLERKRIEAWIMLAIFRGRIVDMVEFTKSRDRLCPFLVSLTPGVSPKYWRDVMGLYLAQIDRLAANEETDKTSLAYRLYGGSPYRRAAMQLSMHKAKAAMMSLTQLRLFKEAYVIARVRHMDDEAREILKEWADDSYKTGNIPMTVVCHLVLGDPHKATVELSKSNKPEFIKLAAEMAKVIGQHTFANHLAVKTAEIISEAPKPEANDLNPLPTRMELLQLESETEDYSQ